MEKTTKQKKWPIFIFILCITLIITLGGTTFAGYAQAARYRTSLEYNYQRAISDLNDCISSIEFTLNKGIYANTATQQNGLAAKLMRETSMAKASLAVLPVKNENLTDVNKFIAQTGDFAMALSAKISAGKTISEEEMEQLRSLEEYAKSLQDNFTYSAPNFDVESLENNFQDISEDFSDYPSLIYDGPFSDHITERESLFLKGLEEIGQKEACERAAKFLSVKATDLKESTESAGNLPTYNFNGNGVRISVSKAGGYIVSFINERTVKKAVLDYEKASKSAREFLEKHGISNMKESYYVINDNICTINYAYADNDIIYYSDLVKISVALDNGEIVEYNASGFLMNHTERNLKTPALSQEEAQKNVSPFLTVESGGLALIPTPGLNEVLTYEFHCTGENNDRVLVYINADTGYEEQIFIIVENDQGILVR